MLENYSYLKRNVNIIIDKHNLQYNHLFIKKRNSTMCYDNENWLLNILNEFLNMRENKCFHFLSQLEMNFMIFYLCAG